MTHRSASRVPTQFSAREPRQLGDVGGDKKDIEIARLRELVKSLADELESAIEAQYDRVKNYPSMKRGYDRDMATVRQARKMLEED
jgi:hypothetical protein